MGKNVKYIVFSASRRLAATAAFFAAAANVLSCGPFFPNNLLAGGEANVLSAPLGDFGAELQRIQLGKSRFAAVPPQNDHAQQAAAADSADLAAALRREKVGTAEALRIRNAHELNRALLQKYLEDQRASEPVAFTDAEAQEKRKPAFPALTLPEGLPREFQDYFEGALAWHNPSMTDKTPARQAWERLLALPEAQRRYKSTWATYMLGRYWETNNPSKALAAFAQVRQLAARGFPDSAGLSAASLGREARVQFRRKEYPKAIGLYLDQLASGDESAVNSLKFVSAEVFAHPAPALLAELAKDHKVQRVLTAYIISQRYRTTVGYADEQEKQATPGVLWLEAMEAAGVKDVDSAEKLALAAYQENQMETAARWIKRAPNTPVSQWINAKLLLRAGKLDEAAKALSRAVPSFPDREPPTNRTVAVFPDYLFAEDGACEERVPAFRRVRAELGVLQLARSEYVSAADSLLQAGYWADAAYVAERVLTTDELKAYVDRSWPAVIEEQTEKADPNSERPDGSAEIPENSPERLRRNIRYLLARRLTRELRGNESLAYYPEDCKPAFRALSTELLSGWDEAKPSLERARALFRAAWLTRTNGLALIGTELQPDFAIYSSDYVYGPQWQDRATNEDLRILRATTNEIQRASNHNADPEQRFHWRYQAAFLAWEAARLMPDNDDETAKMLCAGGTWLKYRDPQTADLFYKALVNRNRHTELGAEADRQRWFPKLDENGHPLPPKKTEPEPVTDMLTTPEEPEGQPTADSIESTPDPNGAE